jgi:hypothetical protein
LSRGFRKKNKKKLRYFFKIKDKIKDKIKETDFDVNLFDFFGLIFSRFLGQKNGNFLVIFLSIFLSFFL